MLEPDIAPGLTTSKAEVKVPRTESGETAEISVVFRAPLLPCDTISRWKMVDAEGWLCFPEHSGLWCAVSVVSI